MYNSIHAKIILMNDLDIVRIKVLVLYNYLFFFQNIMKICKKVQEKKHWWPQRETLIQTWNSDPKYSIPLCVTVSSSFVLWPQRETLIQTCPICLYFWCCFSEHLAVSIISFIVTVKPILHMPAWHNGIPCSHNVLLCLKCRYSFVIFMCSW